MSLESARSIRSTPIRKVGKKALLAQSERRKRVAELKATGEYVIEGQVVKGICPDCHQFKTLTWDHKIKRSQGGTHTKENIDWICWECHNLRDNMADPNKKKPASKKATWQSPHKCKNCKREVSTLICSNCGRMSV